MDGSATGEKGQAIPVFRDGRKPLPLRRGGSVRGGEESSSPFRDISQIQGGQPSDLKVDHPRIGGAGSGS
jgi:hypothetical protein